MELNYNFKIRKSSASSALLGADSPEQSDLYLDKKQGWLDYELEFNPNLIIDSEPKIYSKTYLNNKTIIKTNTLSIRLTNIYVEDKPYYYKLNFQFKEKISLDYLVVDLNLQDIVEYKGNYYTNKKTYQYISETDFLFTEEVLDLEDCNIIYRADIIEIEAPKNSDAVLESTLIKPKVINQYNFYIPSFYLKKDNKIIQCIESDIKIFKSKIAVNLNENLKYKLVKKSFNVSKDFNISFNLIQSLQVFYKISSLCFIAKDFISYFIIEEDGSIKQSEDNLNYTFKIIKKVDLNLVTLTPNNYKNLLDTYDNIQGKHVNSFLEINSQINAFGLIYNPINTLVPKFNYINNISFTPLKFNKNSKLISKSLKTDAFDIRVLPEFKESIDYTNFDLINYLTNKED